MTLDAEVPPRHAAGVPTSTRSDLARLALLTAEAVEAVVDAALADDRSAARRIRRRCRACREARVESELGLRRRLDECPPRTGNLRRTACTLQFIADLGSIGEIVDAFAGYLAVNDVPASLKEAIGPDMAIVGRAGADRLRRLATGLPTPEMDAAYVSGGAELRQALERLTVAFPASVQDSSCGPLSVLWACDALARAVLAASRHASFAV